jgi:hypothetical protein
MDPAVAAWHQGGRVEEATLSLDGLEGRVMLRKGSYPPLPRGAFEMKTVACWNDLRPYGIEPLTGEACGLMWRILFDVTEKGRRVVGKCFGVPNIVLAEPWNRGTAEEPHVGSIMLTAEALLPLAVFALLENGCPEAYLGGRRALRVSVFVFQRREKNRDLCRRPRDRSSEDGRTVSECCNRSARPAGSREAEVQPRTGETARHRHWARKAGKAKSRRHPCRGLRKRDCVKPKVSDHRCPAEADQSFSTTRAKDSARSVQRKCPEPLHHAEAPGGARDYANSGTLTISAVTWKPFRRSEIPREGLGLVDGAGPAGLLAKPSRGVYGNIASDAHRQ